MSFGATLMAAPLTLQSQTTATLEAGSARMRFADSIAATALSVTPAVQLIAPGRRASLRASANLARLSGGWSNSGTLSGSLTTPSDGLLSGEVEVIAGGSSHSNGAHTAQALGFARVHAASLSRGAWVGAGMGRTQDVVSRSIRQGDVGAWIVAGASSIAASLAPTVVGDTIRYMDSYVAAHHLRERWELDGSFGFRVGKRLPTLPANRAVWGSAGAILWAAPRLGLVARAGTYPIDFTQGFPGGRFASLGVRFRVNPETAPAPARRELSRAEGIRGFEIGRGSGSRNSYQIRIQALAARSVEIMADFTGWSPVRLSSDGRGWWATTLPITPGTHQVNVRIDAGAWGIPPGLTPLKDEFGGAVGLLVVE